MRFFTVLRNVWTCSSLPAFLLLAVLFGGLSGCSLFGPSKEMSGWPAERIYQAAKEEFDDGIWDKAIKIYERLESRYPYGKYAEQAQLEVAYAYWKYEEQASGIAACNRFLKLHPNHAVADYALYLRGLIEFGSEQGLLATMSGQESADRDPRSARASFNTFRELIGRFPTSRYHADAIQRMTYLSNTLAKHEINVGLYYMKRGAYLAAANRAQFAIKTYPDSTQNEKALFVLVKSYDKLGMTDLRDDANRVMHNNFPNSEYFSRGDGGVTKTRNPWWRFW